MRRSSVAVRPGSPEPGGSPACARGRVLVPHVCAASLCAGLASSIWLRAPGLGVAVLALGYAVVSVLVGRSRLIWMAIALALVRWWWGSLRLDTADRSPLLDRAGEIVRVRAEVLSPVRPGRWVSCALVRVLAVSGQEVRGKAQLELPSDRASPRRGTVLQALVEVRLPDGPRQAADGRPSTRAPTCNATVCRSCSRRALSSSTASAEGSAV
ncbi:MAG: hypothetical protein OXG37_16480 [Actinomycetia bacterium]|nr:hypothetical protein [Actinomycetes bacterium]